MTTSDIPDQLVDLHERCSDVRFDRTIGASRAAAPLLQWAREIDVELPLTLLLDASRCDAFPKFTGTALAFLRQRPTVDCLREWEHELPFLAHLCALADACAVSPYIATAYPPMPPEHAVARQLQGGELGQLPLIALLARPVPRMGLADERWLESLRVWCFVQFLRVLYGGSPPSTYLLTVVNKLRQAIDEESDWLDLFLRLRGTTDSFHILTRHLAGRAASLLSDTASPVDRPSHRSMLGHLRNVCDGKESESDGARDEFGHGLFARYLQRSPTEPQWLSVPDVPPDEKETSGSGDVDNQGVLAFDPPDSEPTTLQLAQVDSADTPPQQERQSNGVLLAAIEDSQLLPFSWNRPNRHERSSLTQWLHDAWRGDDDSGQELAAMVYIAIQCACSLRTVLQIQLTSELGDDWRLDIERGMVQRRPPRRYNGWRSTPATDAWVNQRADRLSLTLPGPVQTAIMRLIEGRAGVATLENAWSNRPQPPEQAFREMCKNTPGLRRVTSGMLARWLEQAAYEDSGDPVLSQLLASHPRSGLPGACAYASYGVRQVDWTLRTCLFESPGGQETVHLSDPLNGAGSELSPIEPLLRQACADALSEVNRLACDPTQWPRHHNALTAYVVLTLLAGTGSRPVTSPFESLEHFDLSQGHVYIEDKVSSQLHQGRLLPLPASATTLVRDHYLPHLARLAHLLQSTDARLSQACASMAQGEPSRSLPLFFLLSTAPELDWVEVSESSLLAVGLFRWPLPWNLMRHRLPTELKRADLDHEIINGLTGHGEQGTAAYGPYSMRVWAEDAQQALPKLTQLQDRLDLGLPSPPAWPVELAIQVTPPSQGSALREGQDFGTRARRQRRQEGQSKVIDQAKREIEQFVRSRPLDSITPIEWEQLSREMLLTRTGLPQTMGTLRYDTMRQWILERWTAEGQHPRLKKRYLPALEEASPFTENAIGAAARWQTAQERLQNLLAIRTASKTSKRDGLALGIASLMLQSRVADPVVLKDLSKGRNFRLVALGGTAFLEHAPGLDREPMAPCRRYRLDGTAAVLLARTRTGSYRIDIADRPVPTELQQVIHASGIDVPPEASTRQWIQAWLPLVQQCNQKHFPGVIAAYLNGQVVTAGLRHADWLRAHRGQAVQVPQLEAVDREQTVSDDAEDDAWTDNLDADSDGYVFMADEFTAISPSEIHRTGDVKPNGGDDEATRAAQRRCRAFFQAIRVALNRFAERKHSPRRDLDATLRRVIADHRDVSSSCRLLAEWLRSLLWRRTAGGLLSLRSISRYLNALSVCFEAVAYQHDLLTCDEDEVTDFYVQVMDARRTIRPSSDTLAADSSTNSVSLSQEEATKLADAPYKTWHLAFQLLRSFHHLMSRELAVEDPDWSEISPADEILSISPGLILEQEYQHALALAVPSPATASRDELAVGFILLVAMRFGLRGAEVTGLMRDDWVDVTSDDTTVVLVQRHRHRKLKTPAARRQVPSMFSLTEPEHLIVQRFLALWEGISGGDRKVPLFASSQDRANFLNDKRLRWQAGQWIKRATLNPNLSLHHARHTFANRVALMLMNQAEGLWPGDRAVEPDTKQTEHVRRLLLCSNGVTRRSLWALARLMGHAHPKTSVRSYLHMLPELADRNVWANASLPVTPVPSAVPGIVQLDGLPLIAGYLTAPAQAEQTPEPRPGPKDLLRLLYLYQHGTDVARAAFSVAVPLAVAIHLVGLVTHVDVILARRKDINPSRGGKSNLLSHIRPQRWQQLMQTAGEIEPASYGEAEVRWNETELRVMIGPSRQILLYQRLHFAFAKQMLAMWRLPSDCVRTAISRGRHARLLQWADEFGLSIRDNQTKEMPTLQIDTVEVGDPPASVRHRCAILPLTGAGQPLESTYELVLLTLLSIHLLCGTNDTAASSAQDTIPTNA